MELVSNYRMEMKGDARTIVAGELYVAEDRRTGLSVAIRFFPGSATMTRQVAERVESQMRLDHPALPTIYEFGETQEGTPYVVLQDLRGFIPASEVNTPVPIDQALDIAIQLADVFATLKEQGLFHRDINPSNILLGPSLQVKVIDFGSVKRVSSSVGSGFIESLPSAASAYLAPDQLASGSMDERSEIFSFGAILYRLVTGKAPVIGSTQHDIVHELLNRPTWLDQRAHVLNSIIVKCLRVDPNARFQSFDEVGEHLRLVSAPPPGPRYGMPTASAAVMTYPMWREFLSLERLQLFLARIDGRKVFASAAFIITSFIAIIGLIPYAGTRIGFGMAFGGALLAYESLLLLSALIRDH
jgi:serine/threonine protein kinase